MRFYLGLDAGMRAMTAIVIEIGDATRRIVFRCRVDLDPDASAWPLPWIDALDRVMGDLALAADIDIDNLLAMSGAFHSALASVGTSLTSLLVGGAAAADHGVVGHLSSHWQRQYSLPACAVIAWTDAITAGTVGAGVVEPRVLRIALGTIDTVSTTAGALCFNNGSLARQWMRLDYRLHWDAFARLLEQAPGNDGYVMLPWLEAEITPAVEHAGLRRFGFDRHDAGRNVRGLVEGQMMAMANHAAALTGEPIERIIATGGDAADRALLQVAANVFGADVYRLDADDAIATGAALRAFHAERLAAGDPVAWPSVVRGFAEPHPGYRVAPNPKLVAIYAALRREYAVLERLHQHRPPIC